GGRTNSPAAPIPTRCPVTPATAPSLPCRSMTGCSSPAKPARSTSSRPRTALMRPAQPLPAPPSRTLSLEAGALADGEDADSARGYLDCAYRALGDLDGVVEIEGHAEREQQHAADYIAVAEQHDGF